MKLKLRNWPPWIVRKNSLILLNICKYKEWEVNIISFGNEVNGVIVTIV